MKTMKKITAILIAMAVAVTGMMIMTTVNTQAATASTKVTSSVKTNTKVVKMKKKAAVSKVTTKVQVTNYAARTTNSGSKKITQKKTIKKTTKSTYRKASKNKKVRTVTKTTIRTTTAKATTMEDMKSSVPANVMEAYTASGLEIGYDSNMGALGYFKASKGIVLQTASIATFRHEMGHFVSLAENNAANTNEFKAIYNAEKNNSTASEYGKQSSGEYFAESFKDYLAMPGTLKNNRPRTYNYMKKAVNSMTKADVANKWWSAYTVEDAA